MNFRNMKIENIIIEKCGNHFRVYYKNSKKEKKDLILRSPLLYLPFGIEKEYDNYILKLQLKKNNNSKDIDYFLQLIIEFEKLLENFFKKPVKSLIRYHDKFDTLIMTKVLHRKNFILTEVKNNTDFYNFFKIQKKMFLESEILIDKIWEQENIIVYKMKLKQINIKSV